MSDATGRFVWHELMTTDMAGARAFYEKVVGWTAMDANMPGMAYWLFKAGEAQVAGEMELPEEARKMGAPSMWVGYVAVPDVEAAAAKAQQLGGMIYKAPADIPGVGRFAVIADPQRNTICLFSGASEMPWSEPAAGAPGFFSWAELYADDPEAALAFYMALFGWTKGESMPMGDMGQYQMFVAGGRPIGGVMKRPAQMPFSIWNHYVTVGDIDAAAARVVAAGGKVLNGPMAVPNDDWIVQGLDPQGALFNLVGKR